MLINGAPNGFIRPTRLIRQGDPPSPFLFLLCTEGLHGLITQSALRGDIHGFSLSKKSPSLTHLLFADDSLLFCRSNVEECQNFLEVLHIYERSLGQQINKAKTTIFFSKSTSEEEKLLIKDTLGVVEIRNYEAYSGLPSLVGKNKKAISIISRSKFGGIFKVGKKTIPTYTMNCFKLPIRLCNEIEGLIRKFWWGQREDRRKNHWVRWEELCKPKNEGGMGFKNLALFNDALLAKQAWRLFQNKNSLFHRVFKSKIFPCCSFMEAVDSPIASYAWQSILKGREVLKEGMRWRVGDGTSIWIWTDPWLPSEFLPFVSLPVAQAFEEAKVVSLIDPVTKEWHSTTTQSIFSPRDVELIKSIPLSSIPMADKLV